MSDRSEGKAISRNNPDKGPPMLEGAHKFDKGYNSNHAYFSPPSYPGDAMRGNRYMELQNEAVRRDSKKLYRSEYSKIA